MLLLLLILPLLPAELMANCFATSSERRPTIDSSVCSVGGWVEWMEDPTRWIMSGSVWLISYTGLLSNPQQQFNGSIERQQRFMLSKMCPKDIHRTAAGETRLGTVKMGSWRWRRIWLVDEWRLSSICVSGGSPKSYGCGRSIMRWFIKIINSSEELRKEGGWVGRLGLRSQFVSKWTN